MNQFYKAPFTALLTVTLLVSCGEVSKKEDPLKIAEKHNEEKFDNETEKTADFMMYAADMSMQEIQLGELAVGNAYDKAIRDLGSSAAQDHKKALSDLNAMAQKKNITLPETVSNEKQRDCDKLSKKTSREFDEEYAEMMIEQHKDALRRFEKEAEEGSDKEVRTWAFNMLPTLRTHLDHALECERRIGNKGDTAVVVERDGSKSDIDKKKDSKDPAAPDKSRSRSADGAKKDW